MPAPLPQKPVIRKKNRQRNQLLITLGVLGAMAVALILALLLGSPETPAPPPTTAQPTAPEHVAEQPQVEAIELSNGPKLVDDNGRTLWASPTEGQSIELDYLPPGCDFLLHLRPADMLKYEQGRRSLVALGPQGAAMVASMEQAAGIALDDIDELLIGVRGAPNAGLEVAMVIRPRIALAAAADGIVPPGKYRTARIAQYEGAEYRVGAPMCFFAPSAEQGQLYVVALRPAMQEMLESGGAPPPMRREIETLAASSDRDRHVTLITAPSFLFSQGRPVFSGVAESIREPIFEFLPDTVRAGSLSLHWENSFYLEARADPAPEITATRLAALLDSRIGEWSNALQLAVLDLNPAPHGRRVVAQLPAMTRLLAEYARFGVEKDIAVLNAYLPIAAGQNMLAASELMLAQQSAGVVGSGGTIVTPAPRAEGIEEKLKQLASVSFARDTLEMSVSYLSDEIDAPIVILGADLQLEGITKNQSFGMEASGKPAGEILLEILFKANPDKTATGPTDPKQKLVYVVKKDDQSIETVYVTTRAAAAKRGDELPGIFSE